MMIHARFSAINGIRPHEWAVRFLFGGLCCVAAGLIAEHFGPRIGGLFLAFPAVFPAGASLVASHEKKHKSRAGLDGTLRGRTVAAVDAAGAAIGCLGLAGFAAICWFGLPTLPKWLVFILASLSWSILSAGFWLLRKSRLLHKRFSRPVQPFSWS
jgi:hypothetical protein